MIYLFFVTLVSTIVPLEYLVALYFEEPLSFEIFKTCLLEFVTLADNESPGFSRILWQHRTIAKRAKI